MMSFKKISAVGLGMVLVAAGTVQAQESESTEAAIDRPVTFSLSAGAERMEGDTTYQIGFPITTPDGMTYGGYFPFSELEWPLDTWLARVDGSLVIKKKIRVRATLKKDLSDPNDNMADSDWLTENPNQLDIYSESEISDFDALIIDTDIDWIFFRSDVVSLYAGVGFLYQNFEYDGKLIRQYSPSGIPGFEVEGDGQVGITYEITYDIPYFRFGTDLQFSPRFSIGGSFAFSPFVQADDTDNHLMRENGGKISDGDMDGNAIMFDFSAKYNFTPTIYLKAGFQYLKIEVDGTQTQVYGTGESLGTVNEESESSQTTGYLLVGFDF